MPLAINANSRFIAPRVSTRVSASGGTDPYVYSLASGGIGGSIDSNGVYTAPESSYGQETIVVTDDDAATAGLVMNVLSPLELLAQIIQQEVDISDQRVWIFNQEIDEPKDQDMYIVLRVPSCKPFSNNMTYDASSGFNSVQTTNFKSMIDINVKSRGLEALRRKEEVVMALGGVYAQQQQELNGFKIGKLPTQFNNLSELDGSAIPYQFNISINIQYAIQKTKAVDYYDTFEDVSVITELTEE